MKKIGLFYGGTTAKTAVVALKIQEAFTENEVVLIPIEGATRKEFESFDNIIAGTSTWFDGELPTYWDEFMPEIESIDMTGKKVALFGLGYFLSESVSSWKEVFLGQDGWQHLWMWTV